MKKTFGDLDLRKICNEVGIDFAHYTYGKEMCSCCYQPTDMPARYWRGHTQKERQALKEACSRKPDKKNSNILHKGQDYTYIWFKNAYNCGGRVKATDFICRGNEPWTKSRKEYIGWKLPEDKLKKFCFELSEQLGPDYQVNMPSSEMECIEIEYIGKD